MSVETLFIVAFTLLIIEAFVPSLGLLGFGGFIAFVSGVVLMINNGQADLYGLSLQSIIVLGCLIFAAFALFGYFIMKSFRKKIETGIEYMKGQPAEVITWKGNKGRIMFEGENWQAQSDDIFNNGDTAIITGYNKMTLTVKKEV